MMESKTLNLFAEGSLAKTSALQTNHEPEQTESDPGCGQSTPELLAKYDHNTHSWRTSQRCFLETQGDGLAEFLETWPRSGMTRNGIAYQLQVLDSLIKETGCGLLPTPTKHNAKEGA